MTIKSMLLGAATLASIAVPGIASAQNYGYYGYGNNGYYNAPSRYDGYYRDRDGDRGYAYRDRREEERRWRDADRRRRWEWQHRRHWHDERYDDGDRY